MPAFNRRQLFKLRLSELTREAGKAVNSHQRQEGEDGDKDENEPRFPRPPGALRDGAAFLATCERCHACARACPHDAIDQFGPAFGRHEGTPFINPAEAPCHWCEEMPCIDACPSDALRQNDAEPVPPIAKVSLDFDRCLNSQGTLCDTCSYRCPGHIKAIRMVRRKPVIDMDRCTGCGMCLFLCEAEPSAFELLFIDPAIEC